MGKVRLAELPFEYCFPTIRRLMNLSKESYAYMSKKRIKKCYDMLCEKDLFCNEFGMTFLNGEEWNFCKVQITGDQRIEFEVIREFYKATFSICQNVFSPSHYITRKGIESSYGKDFVDELIKISYEME